MMLSPLRKRLVIGAGVAVGLVVVLAIAVLLQEKPVLPGRSGVASSSQGLAMRGGVALGMPAPAYEESAADYAKTVDGYAAPSMPEPYPPTAGPTAAAVDQKIIKNGTVRLVVDKVDESVATITLLAQAKGGFVQTSSTSERADGTHEGMITIRVPAREFEKTVEEIKALAKSVRYASASGQDVTEQYTDLEAQLRNARAQEAEYLNILKKAQTVEDILKVQNYLGSVRGQIESLEGRLQYLENVTAYSTIAVTLEEEPVISVPTKEFRPATVVKEAAQTLVKAFQGIVVSLIWVGIVGGGLGLPVLLLVLIVRAWLRRRKA